jgi:poly-gamma-glutamate capsule biosynthesis protein CapA/YwtB (metallophosphatase superfamily)
MNRRLFIATLRDGLVLSQCTSLLPLLPGRVSASGSQMDDSRYLTLFLGGDVMTGRGIDQVLPHPGDPILYEQYVKGARRYVDLAERRNGPIPKPVDYTYIWGDALDVWDTVAPDLRIVNLETSVTLSDDAWLSKAIHYRMHPRNVPCLNAAGLDCCVLANNHVLDWGRAGLEETLTTVSNAGIATAGAGHHIDAAMRPARLQVPGKCNVLVFGVADASSGVPGSWRATPDQSGVWLLNELSRDSADRVTAHVGNYRRPGDIVIVSIHWGSNWGYGVSSGQRRFAERLIDSGAVDVIHGHSSHHARPLDIYRDRIILYGCGDFITDYEGIGGHEGFRPWHAPMYFASIDAVSGSIERLEIVLLQQRRFRLAQTGDEDRRWFRETLNAAERHFTTVIEIADDRLIARWGHVD